MDHYSETKSITVCFQILQRYSCLDRHCHYFLVGSFCVMSEVLDRRDIDKFIPARPAVLSTTLLVIAVLAQSISQRAQAFCDLHRNKPDSHQPR